MTATIGGQIRFGMRAEPGEEFEKQEPLCVFVVVAVVVVSDELLLKR